MTKISVIIPVYNAEKYLRQCLDSVISQTLNDIEIICVDDGSKDDSGKILDEYAAKDKRIYVIHKLNEGVSTARNIGLERANGSFVAFLDADDWVDAGFYEKLYMKAIQESADVVKGNRCNVTKNFLDKQGALNKRISSKNSRDEHIITRFTYEFWSAIYSVELLKKNNIKVKSGKLGEDINFLSHALIFCTKYAQCDDVFYYYRMSGESVTHNLKPQHLDDVFKMSEDILRMIAEADMSEKIYYMIKKQRLKNLESYEPDVKYMGCLAEFEKKVADFRGIYMRNNLKFSVIVPAYNAAEYLSECLDSVIKQTLKDIEIICINDGSTDDSLKILQRYAKKDKRIIIINQENQGLSCSRNNALKLVQGEYVFFLDADDYIRCDTLEILYNQAKENDLDMLSFSGTNFDDVTRELQKNPYFMFRYLPENFDISCFSYKNCKKFVSRIAVSACLTCYKSAFLQENNIVFPPHLFFEDNVFFTHAILTAERCGICKEILYFRRVHPEQVTQNWNKRYDDYLQICQKVIDLVNSMPVEQAIKEQYRQSYVGNAIGVFSGFKDKDKNKYIEKLQAFINHNSRKKVTRYLGLGFIPLLSVEEL